MRTRIVLTVLGLFLFAGSPAAAQAGFGFGARAGASIPTGDYGDVAETGFLGGVDVWYPLAMVSPGLSWYSSVDAIAHSASADDIDDGFFYVPIMTGLRFDIPVGPVAAFATGQLGLMLTRGPDIDVGAVELASSEFGTSFGYNIGAGLQLTPNIYAGVKYWPLGTRTFEYDGDAEYEREVSFFDIYVGFGAQ